MEDVEFQKLSDNKKLDFVLAGLDIYSKGINEIQNSLTLSTNSNIFQEVRSILEKLINEGYVEEVKYQMKYAGPLEFELPDGQWIISYKLSFEGKQFIKKGGYSKKNWKDLANGWLIKELLKYILPLLLGYQIGKYFHR